MHMLGIFSQILQTAFGCFGVHIIADVEKMRWVKRISFFLDAVLKQIGIAPG